MPTAPVIQHDRCASRDAALTSSQGSMTEPQTSANTNRQPRNLLDQFTSASHSNAIDWGPYTHRAASPQMVVVSPLWK